MWLLAGPASWAWCQVGLTQCEKFNTEWRELCHLVTLASDLWNYFLMGNEEIIRTLCSELLNQCSKLANAACLTGYHTGSCAFRSFPSPSLIPEPPGTCVVQPCQHSWHCGRLFCSVLAEPQSCCGVSLGPPTLWQVSVGEVSLPRHLPQLPPVPPWPTKLGLERKKKKSLGPGLEFHSH